MTGALPAAPIAVALDAPDLATACQWAEATAGVVSTVKVGLETYLRDGADGVRSIQQAAPHAALVASLQPALLTVHALGGPAMIAAAAQALPDTRITAVTILTSMDSEALDRVGIQGSAQEAVLRLAVMAVEAGARALVCSPQEVAAVRGAVGPDTTLITPGVRPAGSDRGDQARIATPEQALADGADLLVIGRPITGAANPREAANDIAASLAGNATT